MNPKGEFSGQRHAKSSLRSIERATAVLIKVTDAMPKYRNPVNARSAVPNLIQELLRECGLPDVPPDDRHKSFVKYWEELDQDHRLRLAIPREVAVWLGKVENVFNRPEEVGGTVRVTWKEGLRRCRSQLLL